MSKNPRSRGHKSTVLATAALRQALLGMAEALKPSSRGELLDYFRVRGALEAWKVIKVLGPMLEPTLEGIGSSHED